MKFKADFTAIWLRFWNAACREIAQKVLIAYDFADFTETKPHLTKKLMESQKRENNGKGKNEMSFSFFNNFRQAGKKMNLWLE